MEKLKLDLEKLTKIQFDIFGNELRERHYDGKSVNYSSSAAELEKYKSEREALEECARRIENYKQEYEKLEYVIFIRLNGVKYKIEKVEL